MVVAANKAAAEKKYVEELEAYTKAKNDYVVRAAEYEVWAAEEKLKRMRKGSG